MDRMEDEILYKHSIILYYTFNILYNNFNIIIFYQDNGVCGNDPFALVSGVDTELNKSLLFGDVVKLDNTSKIIHRI